jgi:hypothetical protein
MEAGSFGTARSHAGNAFEKLPVRGELNDFWKMLLLKNR